MVFVTQNEVVHEVLCCSLKQNNTFSQHHNHSNPADGVSSSLFWGPSDAERWLRMTQRQRQSPMFCFSDHM